MNCQKKCTVIDDNANNAKYLGIFTHSTDKILYPTCPMTLSSTAVTFFSMKVVIASPKASVTSAASPCSSC